MYVVSETVNILVEAPTRSRAREVKGKDDDFGVFLLNY